MISNGLSQYCTGGAGVLNHTLLRIWTGFFIAWTLCAFGTIAPNSASAKINNNRYPFERLPFVKAMLPTLQRRYVDPTQFKPKRMYLAGLYAIERKLDAVWIKFSKDKKSLTVHLGPRKTVLRVGQFLGLLDVYLKLRPVAVFIKKHYRGKTRLFSVEQEMVHALMSTLDKQTGLSIYKQQHRKRRQFAPGKLGILLTFTKGKLIIRHILPYSPARLAGLRKGDIIEKIGSLKVQGGSQKKWLKALTGLRGTKVVLTIKRKGWARSKQYILRRALMPLPIVQGFLLPGKIGYIFLRQFSWGVSLQIREQLARLRHLAKGRLLGLILDLRNNPGGLVNEAVKICSLFVNTGIVTTLVGANIKRRPYQVASGHTEEGYPMVVLLNGYSASASELLSGALTKHNRALIMGRQSYGKGTAQSMGKIMKGVGMRITIAQYLLPDNSSIQAVGIIPDIQLLPVAVTKKKVIYYRSLLSDLEQRKKRWPRFLQQNLQKKKTSWSQIRYLLHTPEHPAPVQKRRKKLSPKTWWIPKNHPLSRDIEIWMARYLLAQAKSARRDIFLGQTKRYIKKLQGLQDKRIVKALKKVKIDWYRPRKRLRATTFTAQVQRVDKKGPLAAGGSFKLRITVKNTGKYTAYRMRAISFAGTPGLQHQEFLFGRLRPGQQRVIERSFQIPKQRRGRVDRVRFTFSGNGISGPKTIFFPLAWQSPRYPQYRITYQILDRTPDGNGDGLLQAGERAILRLTIENTGSGPSPHCKALVRVRGVRFRQPMRTFGRISKNKRFSINYVLRVPDFARPFTLPGKLLVFDEKLGYFSEHQLTLYISANLRAFVQSQKGWLKLKKNATLYASAHPKQRRTVAFGNQGHHLRYTRYFKGYYKVLLPPALFGKYISPKHKQSQKGHGISKGGSAWIHQSAISKVSSVPKASIGTSGLKLHFALSPPKITFQAPKKPILLQKSQYTLSVQVDSLHGIKDVYVTNGKRKVFYKALQFVQPKGKKQVQLKIPLVLKKGVNTLQMVVRSAQGRFQRKLLISYVPNTKS